MQNRDYKDLMLDIGKINNNNLRKVMYILVSVYDNECACNEGDLGFSVLYDIFDLLWSVDSNDKV